MANTENIVQILRASLTPERRQEAEHQLQLAHSIQGFSPLLLCIAVNQDIELNIRQASVIYLKNMVTQSWQDNNTNNTDDNNTDTNNKFIIPSDDRKLITEAVVDAIVRVPDVLKNQLALCAKTIIKHDFPACWTHIVDKIILYLAPNDGSTWPGALLTLYQLVKNYEYTKAEDRGHLVAAMRQLLPMIHSIIVNLHRDTSDNSLLLQKQILKIFFALVQYSLPLDLLDKATFASWMDVMRAQADRPIPPGLEGLDEEEKQEHPAWKCKKWALHTLHRVFERYGSHVTAEYLEFAEWYLPTFTAGILEVLLKILDQYRNEIFVSPRVLQQTFNYMHQAISHSYSWNFLKPHMLAIVRDVILPIMCHSEADDELWQDDPREYVRIKFDIFVDFISPVNAAQTLLVTVCKKRKDMLRQTMQLCVSVLSGQGGPPDPRRKDGALHMVGSLADVLLKKKLYKNEIENMLVAYVFPEFASPHGYLRGRACWVIHNFSSVKAKNEAIIVESTRLITDALLTDSELPVKVEAAIALQMMLTNHDEISKHIEPHVKTIITELLDLINKTENDDVTSVLQKLVCTYTEQLVPIAVEICDNLATIFKQVLEAEGGSDEKAITSMGLLNTIETLVNVMTENEELMKRLEPKVLQVVCHIFQSGVMEFFEEAFSIIYDLTSKTISEDMWKILEMIYQIFQKEGFDYFNDMMPTLYNYVTVDTPAFLSNENHILAIFNMCKAVLTTDSGDDPECHAAKLLEVIVLQCKGRIDACIPSIVELVLKRLTRGIATSELRIMCLQVVIAAFYYNPHLLLNIFEKNMTMNSEETITSHFIKQWIHDTDCFLSLHDRKMCVLGLCTLLSLGPMRPALPQESLMKIMPACIILFDGLKKAYMAKAAEEEEDSDEDDSEGDDVEEVLSTDEDDIDQEGQDYLESLSRKIKKEGAKSGFNIDTVDAEETSDDSDYEYYDDTPLESYTTPLDEPECPIDEYIVFKEVITSLSVNEPGFYAALVANLTQEQKESLQSIFVYADQRSAHQESKRIEQSGGYAFTVPPSVPKTFNFSS